MPVLKAAPLVAFDETNPDHIRAMMEILNTNTDPAKAITRSVKINFDYPHPFASAVAYATHCMAKAWGRQVLGIKNVPEVEAQNVRKLVIGSRSQPLQETASRGLPPGSMLQ